MSIPLTRLGDRAFSHSENNDVEAEYDRLRDLARQEARKRGECFERSRQAYENGDGAEAKRLSNEGKKHGANMERYNKQASEYIFRENNNPERVAEDTIDLHGQFVEEAEDILEARIRDAQARGQRHLHVIVGKGNHSAGGVQKIKPRVEQVCRELGLDYATEANDGRIYVDLTGAKVGAPPPLPPQPGGGYGGGGHGPSHGGHQPHHDAGYGQAHHGGGQHQQRPPQQQQQQQHQQQQQDDDLIVQVTGVMEGAQLPKLTTSLNQGTVEEVPQKLKELWNILTTSEPDSTHASEKFILRWLLKSMAGSSTDAETIRRYPLTWTLMGCLFSRIPLFSLAKALADRRFMAILQQTLKNISSSDLQEPDGDVEMQDAPSSIKKSLKRKRSQEIAFDLSVLKAPLSRLQSTEQVFAALKVLISRISTDANDKANDRMGAEHIRSLFGCATKDALQMMSASLDVCKLAIAEETSECLEGQESWINTLASIWELHMRSGSDARDFALHMAGPSCLVLRNLVKMDGSSSSTFNRGVAKAWERDLQGLITKNLVLPARSEFFVKKGTGIMSAPTNHRSDLSALCPVLFQLVLQAPQPIGGTSMKKDNEEWIDAVFSVLEERMKTLATEQRNSIMQELLASALDQNSSPKTSTLLNVCKEYALGDDKVDWAIVSSVAQCDPDVFLTSEDGRSLLDTILNEAPTGAVDDKDTYEALCSTMLSLASGFVRARDLSKFVKKWFERLTNCSIRKSMKTTEGIFWLDSRISQAVSSYIQEALTTKQLADLINDLSQSNDTPAEAARAVVFDAICQGITIDDFWEAVGTSLFESVWASPTNFKASEVSSAQRRIAAKAFTWDVANDPWEMTGTFLRSSLDQPKLKTPATFEAFRSAIAAWNSRYAGEVVLPQEKSLLSPDGVISGFMQVLNEKLLTEELSFDDAILRLRLESDNLRKESDVFSLLPLGKVSVTTYLAWILFYFPKLLQMLQSTNGLADFVKAVIAFLGRSSGTTASPSRPAFDAFAKALTESFADIPGGCLSTTFVGPVIEILKSPDSFGQPTKPGVAAARLVTSLSSERLQRGDRERLMETVYTLARSQTSADFDGLSWESLLGLMVQLMAKPTFYAEMSIQGLLEIGKLLKKRIRMDKAELFQESRTAVAFKLYGELAYLTFRQMSVSAGARETNFIKEVWPAISKALRKKGRDTDIVPLTLLTAFVVAIQQSPVQDQLSQEIGSLEESKVELSRLAILAMEEHFKGSKKAVELDLETLIKLRAAFMAAEVSWSSSNQDAIAAMREQIIAATSEIRKADVEIGTLTTSFIAGRLGQGQHGSVDEGGSWSAGDSGKNDRSKLDIKSIIKSVDMTIPDGDDAAKAAFIRDLVSHLQNDSNRAINLLTARRVIKAGIEVSSATDESAVVLSMVQNTLTQLLVSAGSVNEFVDGARTIYQLLETKLASVTQWNVEHTLSSIAVVCSDNAINADVIRSSPKMYEWLCLMMEVVLKRHRRRLEGHLHLLITVLQALLTCLILNPYDTTQGSWASGPVSGRKYESFPYWERHAKIYGRLLTLVCEPSAASVMRTHQHGTSAPLDSATDAAKRSAGQYMYLVLMHFIKLQLESDVPHAVREALVPGINSILDVTPPDMRKVMADAMDASGRAIFKDIYEKYRRFGKWRGA
ncbi:hypothetical protein PpBr36_08784 [Pyricularia pennisetigena]|uniref:hypothetical protein n=1 Tax=Pyricularia pennisetigena TaxID=1578925 RepID=UPI001150D4BC|nr:hypothetical protein PpBr36_08784 [Pyricularia pennisetigena]TLS23831.1 hypothetical protein PpBr36_08784 [Pyricularia pennisetigena]